MDGPFKERDVKVAVRDKDSAAKIEVLAELVAERNDPVATVTAKEDLE